MKARKPKLFLLMIGVALLLGCRSPLASLSDQHATAEIQLSIHAAFLSGTSLDSRTVDPADSSRFLLPDTSTIYLSVLETGTFTVVVNDEIAIRRVADAATGELTLEGTSVVLALPKAVALTFKAELRDGTVVIASAESASLTFNDENPLPIELQLMPASTHPALDPAGLSLTVPITRTLDAGKSIIIPYQLPDWAVADTTGAPVTLSLSTGMDLDKLYLDLRKPDGSKLTDFTADYSVAGMVKLEHPAIDIGTHYLILYNNDELAANLSLISMTLPGGSDKELLSFGFAAGNNAAAALNTDVSGTISAGTVNVVVPFGISPVNLVASFSFKGASVSIDGVQQVSASTMNSFNLDRIYRITAHDGSYAEFTVSVSVASSNSKEITAFNFGFSMNAGFGLTTDVFGVVDEGTQTISLTVPFDTNVTGLMPDIIHTGVSIAPANLAAPDFTNSVVYTVTAADTSTKEYTVTVTRLPASSNNDLSALAISSPLYLIGAFDPGVTSYNSAAADSMTSMTEITATVADASASLDVQINGGAWQSLTSGMPSMSLMLDDPLGNNIITVRVTAQNSVAKNYVITVPKTVSITVISGPNGSTVPSGSAEYAPGSIINLEATPFANSGYRFANWTGGPVANPTASMTSYTVGLGNLALTASFEPDFAGGDGTIGTPYQIDSATRLGYMRYFLSSYFVLIGNIDLTSIPDWMPVGDDVNRFSGTLDGAGFNITNLTINQNAMRRGLFGEVQGAEIRNLNLVSVNITGGNNFGALVGWVSGIGLTTQIVNCSVTGTIFSNAGNTGGLVGIVNESDPAGGTVLFISESWTDLTISSPINEGFGGLVGSVTDNTAVNIERSYARGIYTLSGTNGNNSGGLVGITWPAVNPSTITDSYALLSISGYRFLGGLVGYSNNTVITNSYAAGLLTGDAAMNRGLFYNIGGSSASGSFFDSTVNPLPYGWDSDATAAKTTTEMLQQATFTTAAWDFTPGTGVWMINEGVSYPYLRWQGGINIPLP